MNQCENCAKTQVSNNYDTPAKDIDIAKHLVDLIVSNASSKEQAIGAIRCLYNEVSNDPNISNAEIEDLQNYVNSKFGDKTIFTEYMEGPMKNSMDRKTYRSPDEFTMSTIKLLHFNAMYLINMYRNYGLPALVCIDDERTLYLQTDNITYNDICNLCNNPKITILLFTDGRRVADLSK